MLGLKPFIICPKSVLSSWKYVLDLFDCDYYGITNYESMQNCKFYPKGSNVKVKFPHVERIEHIKKTKSCESKSEPENEYESKMSINTLFGSPEIDKIDSKKSKKCQIEYTYIWTNIPENILFIFDEAHRCKNPRTLNSILLYTLSNTPAKIMLLSATICDKPDNFILAGYVLRLYSDIKFAKKFIDDKGKGYKNVMNGVHDAIYPEYANRMRIRDLGKLFPENQVVAELYNMEYAKEIEEQYKLIEDEINRLKLKEQNSGCVLARILYARMRIEQLKIPTFLELARKFSEEGNAVAIFVNFTDTLKTLAKELGTNCVIHGEQTIEDRNKNIADFNSDKSTIIVANIRSGGCGISIHDLHGNYPRVTIISPSWSAIDIIQALGRAFRANGKTPVRQRIIFCKGTIEETICENMKEKIINIGSLNDGDLRSVQINGLTKDPENSDSILNSEHVLSDFDKMYNKLLTKLAKRDRLQMDIKETEDAIKTIEMELEKMIK